MVVGESLREDDPAVAARREAFSSGVRGRGGQGVVRWHVCLECRERPCGGSERTVKSPLANDDVVVVVVIARPRGIYRYLFITAKETTPVRGRRERQCEMCHSGRVRCPHGNKPGFAWGGGPRGGKAEDVSSLLFTLLFPCKGCSLGTFCTDRATFCPDRATFYPDRGTRGVQKKGAKNGGGLMLCRCWCASCATTVSVAFASDMYVEMMCTKLRCPKSF